MTTEMSSKLLDRPAHLFLDSPHAQSRLFGDFGVTIAIEPAGEENLSGKRFEPQHGLLDPREPVAGFECGDRIAVAQLDLVDRQIVSTPVVAQDEPPATMLGGPGGRALPPGPGRGPDCARPRADRPRAPRSQRHDPRFSRPCARTVAAPCPRRNPAACAGRGNGAILAARCDRDRRGHPATTQGGHAPAEADRLRPAAGGRRLARASRPASRVRVDACIHRSRLLPKGEAEPAEAGC